MFTTLLISTGIFITILPFLYRYFKYCFKLEKEIEKDKDFLERW